MKAQPTSTKEVILQQTTRILAREGYEGTSMRRVASATGVEPSVIYNYFADKEDLLRATRLYVNQDLDTALARVLASCHCIRDRLYTTVLFQLRKREQIVALLQYFMAAKADFPETEGGYVPERGYRHMRDIIERGIAEGRYCSPDTQFDAKLLTHLINGFLVEYHDRRLTRTELQALAIQLTDFVERSLQVRISEREGSGQYADKAA